MAKKIRKITMTSEQWASLVGKLPHKIALPREWGELGDNEAYAYCKDTFGRCVATGNLYDGLVIHKHGRWIYTAHADLCIYRFRDAADAIHFKLRFG